MFEGLGRKYNLSGLLATIGIIAFSSFLIILLDSEMPFGKDKMVVAKEYIKLGGDSTGAQNMVTSVVLSFRALDTLGEVTVLFASAMAIAMLLAPGINIWVKKENFVLRVASNWLPYIIGAIGFYIILQGHLTPGGGFQGGVVVATGIMMYFLLSGKRKRKEKLLHIIESIMGASFVAVGLIGLFKYGYFLFNFLPKGKVGDFFSAGILPMLYIFIGIKVSAEFINILDRFTSKEGEVDNAKN